MNDFDFNIALICRFVDDLESEIGQYDSPEWNWTKAVEFVSDTINKHFIELDIRCFDNYEIGFLKKAGVLYNDSFNSLKEAIKNPEKIKPLRGFSERTLKEYIYPRLQEKYPKIFKEREKTKDKKWEYKKMNKYNRGYSKIALFYNSLGILNLKKNPEIEIAESLDSIIEIGSSRSTNPQNIISRSKNNEGFSESSDTSDVSKIEQEIIKDVNHVLEDNHKETAPNKMKDLLERIKAMKEERDCFKEESEIYKSKYFNILDKYVELLENVEHHTNKNEQKPI